jgi:hypothetical protein
MEGVKKDGTKLTYNSHNHPAEFHGKSARCFKTHAVRATIGGETACSDVSSSCQPLVAHNKSKIGHIQRKTSNKT